jgi:hypothetical protein
MRVRADWRRYVFFFATICDGRSSNLCHSTGTLRTFFGSNLDGQITLIKRDGMVNGQR